MDKTSLICKTKDITAALSCADKDNLLTWDSVLLNGKERVLKAPVSLPKEYQNADGVIVPFQWTYNREWITPDGFSVLFLDDAVGCTYRLTAKGRQDINGPVEFSGCLTNTSTSEIRIYPGEIFSVDFSFDTPPTAWTFAKESGIAEGVRWHQNYEIFFPGTGIYKDTLLPGITATAETNTCQDFNTGGKIPMVYLDGTDHGAYLAFEWTSSRITAHGINGGAHISLDLHEGFTTRIPSGGEFMIPPIYIGVYDGDVDDGSNLFKRWFFLEKTPKTMLYNKNEPLTQIDAQIQPENLHKFGIQSLKWDYGWWHGIRFSNPEGFIYHGSWKRRRADETPEESDTYIINYGKHMQDLGINWTVYTLLHDSNAILEGDDQLTVLGSTGHPEWFSDRHVTNLLADLGNEECVEYCKRKLHQFFVRNHINSWRSDFEPIAHRSDKKNRHDANGNDVQYWCSRGFYEIVDYILEAIPGFRYESCSSGGSMKDFATMHRATVFNNDDSADYTSLRTTFYDSSYCFPPAQLQAPCNPDTFCPECQKHYNGFGDKDFGMRAMIMGAIMFGSWCGIEDGHLKHDLERYYREYIPLHNEKIKPLIRDGNLYHTLPRPDNIHWDGMQYGCDFVPENKIGGALFLFKPTDEDGNTKTVQIRGLNPDVTYTVNFYERSEQSYTAKGSEIMKNGLTCTINEPFGSEIVFFVCQ